jgi:hypothetical protein
MSFHLSGLLLAPFLVLPGLVSGAPSPCVSGTPFNTSGSCEVPPGVTSIMVQAWGGGGAGGGTGRANTNQARGGGGGGGGGFAQSAIVVTPGDTLTVTVGAGGAGFIAGYGGDGGDSTIDGYAAQLLAKGGFGGGRNVPSDQSPTGGAGGSANIGDLTADGANGGDGATGVDISSGAGGKGGDSGGGAGGAAVTDGTSDGNAGDAPGGGGSGSRTYQNEGTRTGGAGAAGRVVMTFTLPDPQTSTVVASATDVAVGTTATVTVTVLDSGSAPIQGLEVFLAANPDTDVTIDPASVVTDANGAATFNVTSTVAQTVTFTASYNPDIGAVDIQWRDLPPPGAAAIPTMSAYGLLAMTGLLGLLAGWHQRRRRG